MKHPADKPSSLIKRLLFITFALWAVPVRGQVFEDFSDGDHVLMPHWTGETHKFVVVEEELVLSDSLRISPAYIATENKVAFDAGWEVYCAYAGNPSSSNRMHFYLMSDVEDLSGAVHGYYLQFGGQSGTSDRITLYRQSANEHTALISGPEGSALNDEGTLTSRCYVQRDSSGHWTLYTDAEGGSNYTLQGEATDSVWMRSAFAGFRIDYSPSKSDGYFFMDDIAISGASFIDSIPPELQTLTVADSVSVTLFFSEPLDPDPASDVTNYWVDGGVGWPQTARVDFHRISLDFATPFTQGKTYELQVSGISDADGNTADPGYWPFTYYPILPAGYNDVIFSEIHAVPSLSTSLPNAEFLELYNRSGHTIDLSGWKLRDATANTGAIFSSYLLPPEGYVILCSAANVNLLKPYGSVLGLTGFPSLNNSGDELTLWDGAGSAMGFIAYSDAWYRDPLKASGGWSLEIRDTEHPCLGSQNWAASVHADGGTPGRSNSAAESIADDVLPLLTKIRVLDDLHIQLVFSEPLEPGAADRIEVNLDRGVGAPDALMLEDPHRATIRAILSTPLQQNLLYTATVRYAADCAGNEMEEAILKLGIPQQPQNGDLVINELLFNPVSGNVDFVEWYNLSDNILSSSDLILVREDEFVPDSVLDFVNLKSTEHLIFPGEFFVMTPDPDLILRQYFHSDPATFLAVDGMPGYPDGKGVVTLLRSDLILLERLHYDESWHFELLRDVNGVSLERINMHSEVQDSDNWHSAAATFGFATPGRMNSSAYGLAAGQNFRAIPDVITPNADGTDDFTILSYSLSDPGYVGELSVYDLHGRMIRRLMPRQTLGLSGQCKWDGTDENGRLVRTGVYYVLGILTDPDSRQLKLRETVVVNGL